MKTTTHLSTPEEAHEWGTALGKTLLAGGVVALCGDLGAGKTQVSKGIVNGLGCPQQVSSPTFSIVHEYPGGRLPVFHFDFYRLETQDELPRLGWYDYLDEQGVVIVEWADRFAEMLPGHARWFRLEHTKDGGRTVSETTEIPPQ